MRQMLLVLTALVVPGLWGAAVHWILVRVWPPPEGSGWEEGSSDAAERVAELLDYQI